MKTTRAIFLTLSVMLLWAGITFAQSTTKPPTSTSQKEKTKMTSPGKEIAIVETSMGTFEMELYRSDAPKTVENFVKQADKKYFDGMRVHRVSKGFVIQTGDDKSKDKSLDSLWGTGGKSIWGKPFEDELNPNAPSYQEGYKKGVVAMANRGPNTNTSQFFICLKDVGLPHNYTIFGKVINGLDVVEKIGQVEIIPGPMGPTDGKPKTDVMIKKIHMKK